MHFLWLMTTVVLLISFFDNGNVKGNNLEIQMTQGMQAITVLKERMDSLQNNIEWYISTFLNNKFMTKINSMVEGFAQENVIRINLESKIISMEKENGQQLEKLWTTIGDINRDIENRLLAQANATEVYFGSKLEETVRSIEKKCRGSMSNLNQTLENLYKQITQWRVPKQVNGGWAAWGSWTNCSSTCGKGMNSRVRTCTNPAPANGGNYCDGVAMEYNLCEISSCKVNGGWTAWDSWTSCSSTCGKGMKNRVRKCSNPAPADGGNYCDGVVMEYDECQIKFCEVMARLVSGRLEVLNTGIWGTVCDDKFGTNEATVACRMMGIFGTGSVIDASSVPDGGDPIWLDDVSCLGTETSLFQCGYNEHTIGMQNCHHDEDVGVRCS